MNVAFDGFVMTYPNSASTRLLFKKHFTNIPQAMQLYTPIELEDLQQDLPYLMEISEWAKNFLARPHPDLGRSGAVCPFVPKALKSNSIRLAAIRAKHLNPSQVEEIVLAHLDTFLELEPREREAGLNKVILLVFTDIHINDTNILVDGVQQKLKPLFVEQGLMLGEFHNLTESPGLHNPNFRPLRSPIPLLAIRFMVESDIPFLVATDDISLRIRYLEVYLQRFDKGGKDSIHLSTARQVLALARTQLEQKNLLSLSSAISHTHISDNRVPVSSVVSCPFASQIGLI